LPWSWRWDPATLAEQIDEAELVEVHTKQVNG
jgi:hypothetical protein